MCMSDSVSVLSGYDGKGGNVSRITVALLAALLVVGALAGSGVARDRPFGTSRLVAPALIRPSDGPGGLSDPGGAFSKTQIERFRCTSAGNPSAFVDMSCNTTEYGQDWAPDNEIAVAVNPANPNHIVAGSNDYFYRFNNSTGARQALVPTGFFTSFDGGADLDRRTNPDAERKRRRRPRPRFRRPPRSRLDGSAGEHRWAGRVLRRPRGRVG